VEVDCSTLTVLTIPRHGPVINTIWLVWDCKPKTPGDPINWVELKTTAEIRSERDKDNFERKLLKFWIQSFLLGVPKIIVGFRSRDGTLINTQELETSSIPATVRQRGRAGWDGNVCINFASAFLECG
jgi:RAT1-interacting protein